jgi:hypothetical protein
VSKIKVIRLEEAKIYVNFFDDGNEARKMLTPKYFHVLDTCGWVSVGDNRKTDGLPKAIAVKRWKDGR